MKIPEHLSYSSLSSYRACPRSYYLSRIKVAEPLPAWYFVVGTAVHQFIQQYLTRDTSPLDTSSERAQPSSGIEDLFMAEVERQMLVEPNTSLWLSGGTKDEPVVEERALKLAQVCADRALSFLEDVDVWEIEYDATGNLPGVGLPIKAYIDLIGEHKKHGPIIGDWKTGKSKPKDNLQLETYNCLIQLLDNGSGLESHDFTGLWIMLNPDAPQARPVKFEHTPESLGKLYAEVEEKIRRGVYPVNPQFNCKFCTMLPNCKTVSGPNPRTNYYDTPVQDGMVPF